MPSIASRAIQEGARTHAAASRIAPGPAEIPLVGSAIPLRRDPLGFLTHCVAQYGRVVRFHLGPSVVHLVVDADGVRHVLQDNCQNFLKSWGYDKVRPVLGDGLLTSDGELWKRQRRTIQRAFHLQRIAGFADTITRATLTMIDEWRPAVEGQVPIDVAKEMMALTLKIVGKTLFSVDVSSETDEVGRSMTVLVEGANRRIMALSSVFE